MTLNAEVTAANAWELVFFRKFSVNPVFNVKPYLEPIELPLLTSARIFLVSTFSLKVRPTWYTAGYLSRQVRGISIDDTVVFEGLGQIPTTTADYGQEIIPLNVSKIVIFPFISGNHNLRFDFVPWIPELRLGVWEYKGIESDSTEDLVEAIQAKLETIEFKIDQL
ncbi:hypothetical protein [Calothrix sp. CCY 0018]|uniref:hypothetical protein n=1 Tax=Calothrix sp. CCY 0018 TaxID=3103864 RepID=UPI0039C73F12